MKNYDYEWKIEDEDFVVDIFEIEEGEDATIIADLSDVENWMEITGGSFDDAAENLIKNYI